MADPQGYIPSKQDAIILRRIISDYKNLVLNPRNRPHFEGEEYTPDIYLARTPSTGIPKLTRMPSLEDIPGVAVCDIYHLVNISGTVQIEPIPLFQRAIYNIYDFAIGGNRWVVINRDKPGFWLAQSVVTDTVLGFTGTNPNNVIVLPPGTGLSPSSPCINDVGFGWVAGLIKNLDCLKLEVIQSSGICTSVTVGQKLYMRWDDARQKWVTRKWRDSDNTWVDDLLHFGGGVGTGSHTEASPVVFWIDQGRPRLQLESIAYDLVGPVCSSAGYATFVGGTAVPCHTHPGIIGACDNTFTIRISCDCCSMPGWEGPGWYCIVDVPSPGTGSCPTKFFVAYLLDTDRCAPGIAICSGPYTDEATATAACSPPTATSPCCPGTPIPTTLYAHFSGGTGNATCLDGITLTLKYNALAYGASGPGWQFDFKPPDMTGACALLNPVGCGGSIGLQNGFVMFCDGTVQWAFLTPDTDPSCTGDIFYFITGVATGPASPVTCSPFSATYDINFGGVNGATTILVNTTP